MAGIMDFFKPAQPQQPVQQQQAPVNNTANQPQGMGAQPPQGNPQGGTTDPAGGGQNPQTPAPVVNPMDAYTAMWDNKGTPAEKPPVFALDPKILSEAAGTINFTQGIPPDLMAKATSGDAQAMVEMMNLVGRAAYQQSLSHSSALTDKFVSARSEFDLKGVGSKVKSDLTQSALADSPNYAHPVVKAEFTRIANAYQAQNPEASPAQIAKATKDYMQDLHQAMNPAAGQTGGPVDTTPKPIDWEQWINN